MTHQLRLRSDEVPNQRALELRCRPKADTRPRTKRAASLVVWQLLQEYSSTGLYATLSL